MATPKRRRENIDWFGFPAGAAKGGPEISHFYEGLMQMNRELIDLVGRRSRAYMDLPQEISNCKSPDDVFEAEMDFWNAAQDHYTSFAERCWLGQRSILAEMVDGQKRQASPRAAAKATAKRKSPARKKSTRRTTRRRTTQNGSGVFSFPEHVEGRPDVRGRVH